MKPLLNTSYISQKHRHRSALHQLNDLFLISAPTAGANIVRDGVPLKAVDTVHVEHVAAGQQVYFLIEESHQANRTGLVLALQGFFPGGLPHRRLLLRLGGLVEFVEFGEVAVELLGVFAE